MPQGLPPPSTSRQHRLRYLSRFPHWLGASIDLYPRLSILHTSEEIASLETCSASHRSIDSDKPLIDFSQEIDLREVPG